MYVEWLRANNGEARSRLNAKQWKPEVIARRSRSLEFDASFGAFDSPSSPTPNGSMLPRGL